MPPRFHTSRPVRDGGRWRRRLAALAVAGAALACGSPSDQSTAVDGWQAQRPEFDEIAERLFGGDNSFFGNTLLERLEKALERRDLTPRQRLEVLTQLAAQYLRVGEVDRAVAQVEEAAGLAAEIRPEPQMVAWVHRLRGLAYLRKAETENCVLHRARDACIFPLRGGGVHHRSGPAREARRSYQDYLELQPGDGGAAWLLNVISMAIGDHPEGVPAYYRIPPSAFESEDDIGRFEDVAQRLGVDTFNNCGGAIADDFDGDGLLDIVTSTWDPQGPLTYYRNQGDGGFADLSAASRLDDQLGGLNLIGGDYDGDADLDILVLRGAWLFDAGRIRNSLLRNEGDGTFTDVTRQAGLAEPAAPTQAAVWGDFDNDGDLDLYVANEMIDPRSEECLPAQLFRNEGDGTFTDVAATAGVTNDRHGKGVTAGDYDNDGDLDLYVSNIGPNRLYRNDGGLTFVDVAGELGVTAPEGRSFAPWFFDYDNDGWLDLFVAAYQATLADVAADFVDAPHNALLPALYRNRGDGSFTDVTREVGLAHVYLPMGANFGDLDNDGWLDLYLSTGDPDYETLVPNIMLRNDGGRRFLDITASSGLGHLQKGHGVAFADLDNDGDQDLYHQLGGFVPGDRYHNALFLNRGHGNRFLTVELRGQRSNAYGVGARLAVTVETEEGERVLHRAVGSVSSFGGSPLRQEIGLGPATAVRRLEVWWPASGTRQLVTDLPIDAAIRVVEGRDGYELLDLPRFDLAAVLE